LRDGAIAARFGWIELEHAITRVALTNASDIKRDNHALEERLKSSKQEITQLQQNLETVRHESLTDPLTTLANREQLEECPPADSETDGCGFNPRVN